MTALSSHPFTPDKYQGLWTELSPSQIAFCDHAAERRRGDAIRLDRQPHNGATTDAVEAMRIERLGVRGEAVGYLYLKPVKWNAYVRKIAGVPDLEDWIDVKTRQKRNWQLIVQKDDPEDWAYVLVLGHAHPRYWLRGWAWGHECKIDGEDGFWGDEANNGRPAYFVPHRILRPMPELFDEVRRRQERIRA